MVKNVNRTARLQWKVDAIKKCIYLQCSLEFWSVSGLEVAALQIRAMLQKKNHPHTQSWCCSESPTYIDFIKVNLLNWKGLRIHKGQASKQEWVCICLSVGVFFVCQDDFSFGALLRSGELPKRSGPPVDQHIMQQNLVCTLFFHRSGSNVICQNTHENLSPAVAFVPTSSWIISTFLVSKNRVQTDVLTIQNDIKGEIKAFRIVTV